MLSDIIAEVRVALVAIPQSIAYGILANLTAQHGIYSYFVGCFIYLLFGIVVDATVAPSSITAIMIQGVVAKIGPATTLLTLMAGAVICLYGWHEDHLNGLVKVITKPVIIGFTTAAYLTIGSVQLPLLLGISSVGKSNDFFDAWKGVIVHIEKTRSWDAVLGFSSIAFLGIFRLTEDCGRGRWKIFFKHLALLRNALVLIVGASLAYVFSISGLQPFKLTGHVDAALPGFHVPPLSITHNGTYYSFFGMVSTMGTSIITIPLVAILEIISIRKLFERDQIIEAAEETLVLGMCNLAVAFFSPLMVTGSFKRIAINNSGFRTVKGQVMTTAIFLLALPLLADAFYYIPKASLAAIVISALISMMDFREIAKIWQDKKHIFPFLGVFVPCIFLGLNYGILIGITFNTFVFIYLYYDDIKLGLLLYLWFGV